MFTQLYLGDVQSPGQVGDEDGYPLELPFAGLETKAEPVKPLPVTEDSIHFPVNHPGQLIRQYKSALGREELIAEVLVDQQILLLQPSHFMIERGTNLIDLIAD